MVLSSFRCSGLRTAEQEDKRDIIVKNIDHGHYNTTEKWLTKNYTYAMLYIHIPNIPFFFMVMSYYT